MVTSWRMVLAQPDRRALERAGWRTTLEFREDHVRAADGTLVDVRATWVAEAEGPDGDVLVALASGATASSAWASLRSLAEARRVRAA